MGPFAALVLATPIFGLTLAPPQGVTPFVDATPTAYVAALLQEDDVDMEASASVDTEAPGPTVSKADADEEGEEEEEDYATLMKRRAELTKIHRPFGIATYAAMALAVVAGTIQYYNLYGFFAGQGDNPCVQGNAVFGQGQCSGTPWIHLTTGLVTAGLYTTTFTISLLMPDPDNASEGDSEFAENLRLHKTLRWVHFGGMVAQMLLGIGIANPGILGIDRANDYGAMQGLATVHLATGLITFGAMTWAMLLLL
ncbi:MAG: hypothetical protein KC416_08620 [Myxococcales bacterium]|nr:hypothetical protein [Myxococcales bacterium]